MEEELIQLQNKAQAIIAEAKTRAEEILLRAKEERDRLIKDAQERAVFDTDTIRQEIEESTQGKLALIDNRKQREAQELKRRAGINNSRAREFLKNVRAV